MRTLVYQVEAKLIWVSFPSTPPCPAASAVPAVQLDWIQAAGDSQLQERQRCGEQQDEAGQAGAL